MVWNLRFIHFEDPFTNDSYIELSEVFYDSNENPEGYARPHLVFDSADEIEMFIERVRAAATKPFLTENEFPKREDLGDEQIFHNTQAEN